MKLQLFTEAKTIEIAVPAHSVLVVVSQDDGELLGQLLTFVKDNAPEEAMVPFLETLLLELQKAVNKVH